jgi:starch phosphorylase
MMYGATPAAQSEPTAGTPITADALRDAITRHLRYSIGKDIRTATVTDWRLSLSRAVRDLLVDPWFATTTRVYGGNRKRVYYLSMEFLIGRLLEDAIHNMGLDEAARAAVESLDIDYRTLVEDEPDAALGNGGLGRLAACFLDSMSTVGVAAHGYGIRYAHGLFKQSFHNGWQGERAEDWLSQAHPWEFERLEVAYPISFGGEARDDGERAMWKPAETIVAAAFDTPVPGWRGRWANTLRLWSAHPVFEFDLERFNHGDYLGAAAPSVLAETISRVLYPDDTTPQGKELRLKQEYFFTAASLADILRRFKQGGNKLADLPKQVAIQLNDTHPAIAGPELIRQLMDHNGYEFEDAFELTRRCLNYTNHTLLPEALERWRVDLMSKALPRHMQIIEKIDRHHARQFPRPDSIKIVDHGDVRMGDLAFICANRVNGVSALHTDLMKKTVFKDLHALHPERIVNQTNGVTPRRWIWGCNPGLRDLLNETIGSEWVTDLDRLKALEPLADDEDFRHRFMAVKAGNKKRLAAWLLHEHGFKVDETAMFDIQIKRIHEYKRQLMNILEAAALRNAIHADPDATWTPRVKVFGGKAAPGYAMAKLIIKLINDIGRTINEDPLCEGRLRVIYPPNYNVSMAEVLIPAADLSEQISTAGKEASGTGNMKFSMNGALTVGTLDGANVEIREAVGPDNIFIFGHTADEVLEIRRRGYDPNAVIAADPRLARVVEQIEDGTFSPDEPNRFAALVDNLRHHDWFQVCADFGSYYTCQREIDKAWQRPEDWARTAILNAAGMGMFSSDRTIRGYARDVWDVVPEF